MLCHPRPNRAVTLWFGRLIASGTTVIIPEIADYEVRRELIRAKLHRSLQRLDFLKGQLGYLPLTTVVMLRAAELWAQARNRGTPTADPKELDGDVILAAQAEQARAVVATDNVSHLALFVEARNWEEIA
jgi:predicted nucleic acid-binding protein